MATGDDEPMRDAPAPKPRRRFAPQLVEETVKTSSSSRKPEVNAAEGSAAAAPQPYSSAPGSAARTAIPTPTTRTTRDASVQVNDVEMCDAPPPPPKNKKPARRFVPEPIETTFNTNRTAANPHGPTAEPTPDPSPTTPQPPSILINGTGDAWQQNRQPQQQTESTEQNKNENTEKKPKRRFAPQLIETSRRARRTGQEGPATKPTDKTDITPGTNHIYAPRPKRKILGAICAVGPRPSMSGAVVVAESEDDDDLEGSPRFLTPRRQPSMKPHPNTRRGTKSSFIPDLDTIMSSESGSSSEENDDEAPSGLSPMAVEEVSPVLPDSRTPEGDLWNGMRHELRERRESCDEEISGYLLAVAAKEAFRQRQIEQVMSAFPNGLPPAGVEHFVAHDNSEDEDFPDLPDETSGHTVSQLVRRKSTDPGWAVREMRAHAEKLANLRAQHRPSVDMDVDQMDPPPPEAPLWASDGAQRGESSATSPALRPKADPQKPPDASPLQQKSQQAEGGFRPAASPFGLPPGFRGMAAAAAEEEDDEAAQLRKMRQAASPPMLGKDLVFRRCLSPQVTRIEPNHPYSESRGDANRDATGGGGLWGGYCTAKPGAGSTATAKKKVCGLWGGFCTSKANEEVAAMLHPSAFLATPAEPATPGDASTTDMLTPQPSACSSRQSTRQQPAVAGSTANGCLAPGPGPGSGASLHMLSAGLDERLRKEKARKELEERIQQEFDDVFVTQVYNYISLGYPATARAFDDELSKISGIEIEQLRKDDRLSVGKGFMLEMELAVKKRSGSAAGSRASSGGDDDDDEAMLTPEEDERRHRNKPPRWRALKLYIREWARQHPSFDDGFGEDENPLAWGVRARRGSWAI